MARVSAKQQYIATYQRLHPDATKSSAEYHWRVRPGQGRTRQELRGHAQTPEHGGVLTGIPRHVQVSGHDIHRTASDNQAERYINRAATHEDARVVLWVHSTTNGWQVMGGKRGYSADYLAGQVGKTGGIRLAIRDGAIHGGDGTDSDTIDDVTDIDAWQVDELER